MSTTTETGAKVTITNNLSVALEIYDVFNPSQNGEAVAFQYTKLDTIAAGETKDVTAIRKVAMLQAMYTGTVTELENTYYYQFPIKIMSATQFSFGTPPPLVYTIEETDKKSMIESYLFHKYAMSNPNAVLTKNLNAAIEKGDSDAINTFFSGTKNFSNCTLSSWNAVMNWLSMFTSPWQGMYYIYESAPANVSASYVPNLLGTLSIVSSADENSAVLTMCTQDSKGNPVYSDPKQETKVIMNGDGTLGDKNPGMDVSISLTPVWMNVLVTEKQDGKSVSNYVPQTTLSGTVAGKKAVSTQTAKQLPGKPKSDEHKGFPFEFLDSYYFSKISQIVGFIVGVGMLYEMMKSKNNTKEKAKEEAKEEAKSETEYNNKVETIEKNTASEISEEFTSQKTTIESNAQTIETAQAEVSQNIQKDTMNEAIDSEATQLQEKIMEQMQNGDVPTNKFEEEFQKMQESLQDIKTELENGNIESAKSKLDATMESASKTIESHGNQMKEWESESLTKTTEALNDAAAEAQSIENAQKESLKDQKLEDPKETENTDIDTEMDAEITPEFG